jgi:hypothetical protein
MIAEKKHSRLILQPNLDSAEQGLQQARAKARPKLFTILKAAWTRL